MTTVLVRIKEDKQLVGLFTYQTESVGELFNLVDQCMNPNECEYLRNTLDEAEDMWYDIDRET